MHRQLLFLSLLVLLLVACQPQVITVEVTRPAAAGQVDAAPTETASEPATPQIVVQEVTRVVPQEVTVEVTKSPLGSPERPVQLLFPPVVDTAVISERAAALADALSTATGSAFTVGILDSEQAVTDLMCAAPVDTIGFISPAGYALGHERCGVQISNVAEHADGLTWQTGMIVTRRDSGLNAIEDLAGKRWAVPDTSSLSNFVYFQALLAAAGVEPGEIIEVPGDSAAMLAVFNGDADFATATYTPPIMPFEDREWQYGEDSPEIWRQTGVSPTRSPIGYVIVITDPEDGGYRLRDARARIFDVEPGIYDQTQIVALSGQIPNETVAFGRDFPLGLARAVTPLLETFALSETCGVSLCASDFYGWTGLPPAADSAYEPLRFVRETLDLSAEDVLSLVQ